MITTKDFPGVDELHQSDCKKLLRNPEQWAHDKMHKPKSGKALIFGTAGHLRILQPEKYTDCVGVLPADFDGRTKEGKEAKKRMEEKYGENIITAEENEQVMGMAISVMHSPAAEYIGRGEAEKLVKWTDTRSGQAMAGIIDYRVGNVLLDLKTCEAADKDNFSRAIAHWGYDIQVAAYMAAVGAEEFLWIAVEKTPPYSVAVYRASENIRLSGEAKLQRAIQIYRDCLAAGKWQSWPHKIQDIELPGWAL